MKCVLNISLAVLAYAYLGYLLITYDYYPQLLSHFAAADCLMWFCLLFCLLLMPLNLLLEAVKWRCLLQGLVSMSLGESVRQVLKGLQGAFLTPARLGDYPARVTRIADSGIWPKAIAMGFVGSAALTAMNILGGVIALLASSISLSGLDSCWVLIISIVSALLLMGLTVCFLKSASLPVIGWSALRYLVYSLQFILVLRFVGVDVEWPMLFVLVPIYYMLVTVIPAVPAADPAIKGSVSALVFSCVTTNVAPIALAAVLLWAVNTVIPMLFGMFWQNDA